MGGVLSQLEELVVSDWTLGGSAWVWTAALNQQHVLSLTQQLAHLLQLCSDASSFPDNVLDPELEIFCIIPPSA